MHQKLYNQFKNASKENIPTTSVKTLFKCYKA